MTPPSVCAKMLTRTCLSVDDCGVSKYSDAATFVNRIVGGMDARSNEFPWQVNVRREFALSCVILICSFLLIADEILWFCRMWCCARAYTLPFYVETGVGTEDCWFIPVSLLWWDHHTSGMDLDGCALCWRRVRKRMYERRQRVHDCTCIELPGMTQVIASVELQSIILMAVQKTSEMQLFCH